MTFMDMQWESEEQQVRWQTEGCPARGCGLTWFWGLPGWRWQNPGPGLHRVYLHGRREEVIPWPLEAPMSEALLEVPRCDIGAFFDPAWRTGALRMILAWVDCVHAYEDWVAGKYPDHASWWDCRAPSEEVIRFTGFRADAHEDRGWLCDAF